MTAPVRVEVADRIGTVTLDRPDRRNAINDALLTGLRTALADLDSSGEVDAIVLTGADPAFCAGVDLAALAAGEELVGAIPGAESFDLWTPTCVPVIGAVNGAAMTGGLELALNCDLLLASDRARFADTHARVGVLPTCGLTTRLPAAIGRQAALRMSLTARPIDAAEALRLGLVTDVVPHDDLLPAARALAAEVVALPGPTVRSYVASYRSTWAEADAAGRAIETRTSRGTHTAGGGAVLSAACVADVVRAGRES